MYTYKPRSFCFPWSGVVVGNTNIRQALKDIMARASASSLTMNADIQAAVTSLINENAS